MFTPLFVLYCWKYYQNLTIGGDVLYKQLYYLFISDIKDIENALSIEL